MESLDFVEEAAEAAKKQNIEFLFVTLRKDVKKNDVACDVIVNIKSLESRRAFSAIAARLALEIAPPKTPAKAKKKKKK